MNKSNLSMIPNVMIIKTDRKD